MKASWSAHFTFLPEPAVFFVLRRFMMSVEVDVTFQSSRQLQVESQHQNVYCDHLTEQPALWGCIRNRKTENGFTDDLDFPNRSHSFLPVPRKKPKILYFRRISLGWVLIQRIILWPNWEKGLRSQKYRSCSAHKILIPVCTYLYDRSIKSQATAPHPSMLHPLRQQSSDDAEHRPRDGHVLLDRPAHGSASRYAPPSRNGIRRCREPRSVSRLWRRCAASNSSGGRRAHAPPRWG